MPQEVVNNAVTKCSMGLAPGSLIVVPANKVMCGNQPAANIMDHAPMVNIMPFGMCKSPANPVVAAAALGVLTPMPYIPATAAPWTPGALTVMIGNQPALDSTSKWMCN